MVQITLYTLLLLQPTVGEEECYFREYLGAVDAVAFPPWLPIHTVFVILYQRFDAYLILYQSQYF